MKSKLPLPYLIPLIFYIWVIGIFLLKFKGNEQFLLILYGSGVSVVMAFFTYYIIVWSLNKSNKKFYLTLAISTLTRFSVSITSIFIAYHFAQIYFLSFVIALLSTYVLFLFAEVYVLYKLKFEKR